MTYATTFRRLLLASGTALLIAGCAPPVAELPAYVVFFTPDSTAIDAPAQAVVVEAAKAARDDTSRLVTVAGYAAPNSANPAGSDMIISRNRSLAVANALVAQGVAQSRIKQQPRGSAGGDPSVESRRVEIVLGR